MITKEHLTNAVHNNPHGYGLILKDGNGHAQLIKKFRAEGNDPEEIYDLLEDNKDIERILHVRWSTKGATDESNTQPFSVYHSNKRQVWFMHNGTLGMFGEHNTGKSDTLDFCEKILTPGLSKWKGDYIDPDFWKLIVEKQWVSQSKGLFISNDMPFLKIGYGWSEYKHKDGGETSGEVWISNNDYFDKLSRGPYFQRLEDVRKASEEAAREEARKEREAQLAIAGPFRPSDHSRTIAGTSQDVQVWDFSNARSSVIVKAVTDIIDRWDLDDPELLAKLSLITYDEWVDLIDNEGPYSIAALMGHMADQVRKQTKLVRLLQAAKKRGEQKIIELKKGTTDVSQTAEAA
jgi:hypothetical protein